MLEAIREWWNADLWEWHNRWYGILWVIGLFDLDKLSDEELDKHLEEMHYFYEGILWGVIVEAALSGVFFALIAGWVAGVLAAGLLSFYWLIQFRRLKIEPFLVLGSWPHENRYTGATNQRDTYDTDHRGDSGLDDAKKE
jgi:hypothetical protein